MTDFYDREGKPLELLEWATRYENVKYRRVIETKLDHHLRVSTIWVGYDINYPDRRATPLIYETMIFGGSEDKYCQRWATEAAALAGHDQLVAWARDGFPDLSGDSYERPSVRRDAPGREAGHAQENDPRE